MRRVKFLSMVAALSLTVSMFAACSQETPPANNSASPSSSASPTATEQPRTTLRVEVFDRANENGTDPTNNYWTDWIKEQVLKEFNMEVTFESVPRSEEVARLNVIMAGGTPPDVVFTYDGAVAYNYYKQGGLADLTDAISKYGSTLTGYLGDEILEYGKYEGKQYLIPAKRISLAYFNTFIRKDWLEALGLPMPQNMDEYYNTLVAFKEKNPGKTERVIPFGWYTQQNIVDSFTEYSNMTEEEQFVYGFGSNIMYKGYKEGIRFLNKMYNAGLMDTDFPLYTGSENDDLVMRGLVGSWGSNYDSPIRTSPGVYNQLKGNVSGAEIAVLDCFVNTADGTHMRQKYQPYGVYNFVPESSKNVEGAVKYLDWLCRDDVRIYIASGEEGVNHNKDADGIPVMINLQNDNRMMNSYTNLDYALVVNGIDLGIQEKNLLALSKSYEEQYTDWFMDAYNTAMHDAIVFIPYAVPPINAEAQYITTLNEKKDEIVIAAVTASDKDFDSVWEAGIAEWLSIGGQACIDERQAYWDSAH